MRWECGAPLWAWCCCARGTSCDRRWKATPRWRREEPLERNTGRKDEASGRNDTLAVHRTATESRAGAGSFRAHTGMRRVPDAAAGAGTGIAAADAGDAGRRRAVAVAAGSIPGTSTAVNAMDLGPRVWTGSDRRLRTLYRLYPAVAATTGTGGIWRVKPARAADFSGGNVERVAIHDHTPRGAGDADPGGIGRAVLPAEDQAGFGAGAGLRGILRGAGGADGGDGLGDAQGPVRRCELGGNDQGRYFPVWRPRES